MRQENRPILLTVSRLLKPIVITKEKLSSIENEINSSNQSEIVLQGLFVLLISSFEIMISDILKYYLKFFPNKLSSEQLKFSKDEILTISDSRKLLINQIDKHVNSLFYENINAVLEDFMKTLSILCDEFGSNNLGKLIEFKESRNLLLHNNLVVNSRYLEKAGEFKRSNNIEDKLNINKDYLIQCLQIINEIINSLEQEIKTKYLKYTKVKALKELWQYLFDSPILKFDDYWIYNENKDEVPGLKRNDFEDSLSGSERMFLGMWRVHFNGDSEHLHKFNMKSLDSSNQEKMLYFLSVLKDISIY